MTVCTYVTGIVLAGGLSSRMGKDKSLILFRGKPLISHAIDILRTVCEKVIISANHPRYEFTGCEIWPDELPVQAPMNGLYSCLRRSETDWNILLSCDMPLVDPRIFELMLQQREDFDAVLPVHAGNLVEPLCGLYNKSLLARLEFQLQRHQYSLQKLASSCRCKLIVINREQPFYSNDLFLNINTPSDLDLHSSA